MDDELELDEFCDLLDYENYDYLYHETSSGLGDMILEEGLLIDGNNIIGARNILETTSLPLTQELTKDKTEFKKFILDEKSTTSLRDVSDMVILIAPKHGVKRIISETEEYGYEGIVEPRYIMGYIKMDSLSFVPNYEYCELVDFSEKKETQKKN